MLLPIGVHISRVNGSTHKVLLVEEQTPAFEDAEDVFPFMVSNPEYIFTPGNPLSSRHYHCANMGMADGHVELLGPNDLPATTVTRTASQAISNPAVQYNYYFTLPH